jgi:heme/copper-type cytochrome/quinol oxidase subunit 2
LSHHLQLQTLVDLHTTALVVAVVVVVVVVAVAVAVTLPRLRSEASQVKALFSVGCYW